jgi:hypothetical protein
VWLPSSNSRAFSASNRTPNVASINNIPDTNSDRHTITDTELCANPASYTIAIFFTSESITVVFSESNAINKPNKTSNVASINIVPDTNTDYCTITDTERSTNTRTDTTAICIPSHDNAVVFTESNAVNKPNKTPNVASINIAPDTDTDYCTITDTKRSTNTQPHTSTIFITNTNSKLDTFTITICCTDAITFTSPDNVPDTCPNNKTIC